MKRSQTKAGGKYGVIINTKPSGRLFVEGVAFIKGPDGDEVEGRYAVRFCGDGFEADRFVQDEHIFATQAAAMEAAGIVQRTFEIEQAAAKVRP